MKKFIFVVAMILMLSLSGCGNQDMQSNPIGNANNTHSQGIVLLDPGVWPNNAYTEGLPVPPGTVAWATLDTEHKNCSISMMDIGETDYTAYLETLQQEGFSVVETVSEEIQGQNYVSSGSLLSDGEIWLSVSYIPRYFTIYITFDH